jgi:hypothetical protein
MNRRLTRIAVASALVLSSFAAFSSAASADTVTLGSTLANDFQGGISTGPTLSVQLSYDLATSPNPVVSPADGVITGWKVKSADDGAIYTLKAMRPNGPVSLLTATNSNFTAVASVQAPSAVPVGTGATTPTGVIFSYPASLPISKGDYIGVLTGGDDDDVPQITTSGVAQNLIANNFTGLPADGTSANLLADEQHDLLLQATLEFTPPGNPTSPVNPAGKVRKRKCKKKAKHRSAEAAKKKKCKTKKKR